MDSTSIPPPPPPTTVPFTLEADNHVTPAANANATATAAVTANHNHNHPPYAEMIYRAIEALKEKDGSSKRAIGKYIEQVYRDLLPPAHSTLLTQHLKHLKTTGLLVMVKKSYKLPSTLPPPIPIPIPLPRSDPQTLRGRGRPPKPKPIQNAEPVFVALGLADDPPATTDGVKRGPGRPPKIAVGPAVPARRGRPPGTARSRLPKRPGRPPKPKSVSNGLKRRPGRPPKIQSQPTVIPFAAPSDPALALAPGVPTVPVGSPRPRGRPRKNAGVGAAPAPPMVGGSAPGMGQGRPPKLAVLGRPKNPTGRPVGRPKGAKAASTAQKAADEDLRRKLEYFQSKVKESLDALKPYFNHESPVTAIAAIQELEILATLDLKAPLRDVTQQLQQSPEQLPPPQQLPPQQLPPQQLPQAQMYQQQYLQIPPQPQLQQLFQPHSSAPS